MISSIYSIINRFKMIKNLIQKSILFCKYNFFFYNSF